VETASSPDRKGLASFCITEYSQGLRFLVAGVTHLFGACGHKYFYVVTRKFQNERGTFHYMNSRPYGSFFTDSKSHAQGLRFLAVSVPRLRGPANAKPPFGGFAFAGSDGGF
jgi:hypothetical protein